MIDNHSIVFTSLHISIQSFQGKLISRIIKFGFNVMILSTAFQPSKHKKTLNQEFSRYNFNDSAIHLSSSIINIVCIKLVELKILFASILI
jgi:hypothetical protein